MSRCRSFAYRARRIVRHAARRQRAAARAAAFAAFERTPEYIKLLEEQIDLDRLEGDGCSDLDTGGRAACDEGLYCERHYLEAAAEHAWMAHVPLSAVTGVLSDAEEQDLRDAGRGHLVRP